MCVRQCDSYAYFQTDCLRISVESAPDQIRTTLSATKLRQCEEAAVAAPNLTISGPVSATSSAGGRLTARSTEGPLRVCGRVSAKNVVFQSEDGDVCVASEASVVCGTLTSRSYNRWKI